MQPKIFYPPNCQVVKNEIPQTFHTSKPFVPPNLFHDLISLCPLTTWHLVNSRPKQRQGYPKAFCLSSV
nr:MAG TPA: hypothetical protein [Caudoviricetes sp.]